MKVIFMAKETSSSCPALEFLINKRVQVCYAVIRKNDKKLRDICEKHKITTVDDDFLKDMISKGSLEPVDYVFSFYWKRISKIILDFPLKGSINFHPGPLPEARGCGYNAAILESWGYYGVTAHYMDEEFDTGMIIQKKNFKISEHILNNELVKITHDELLQLFKDVVSNLLEGKEMLPYPQGKGMYYSLTYIEGLKEIDLGESAENIDRKIRAFWNPPYNGATITINGKKYTLINEDILNKLHNSLTR